MDLRRQQPEAANVCAELIMDREFERGAVYYSQVLRRRRIDIHCAVAERKPQKLYITLTFHLFMRRTCESILAPHPESVFVPES